MIVLTGFGLGLAYLPAIVAVSFYFEKRRSLATGIAVCGSGVGTFLFAPLTSLLLHEYSWKGTVVIETGILLNCILCGMVFRPLNLNPSDDVKKAPVTCPSDPNHGTAVYAKSADAGELSFLCPRRHNLVFPVFFLLDG